MAENGLQCLQVGDQYSQRWNAFIVAHSADGGFLQSWQWGEFQKSLGNRIFRFAVVDGQGALQAAALVIKNELPFEYNYLYAPRGPVMSGFDAKTFSCLRACIDQAARDEKSFLVRFDPSWPASVNDRSSAGEDILRAANWRKGDYEIQPKCAFIIDLARPEEEILGEMKTKTRYNINLAQRKGVHVRTSGELADLEEFWTLTKQTAARDGFNTHAKEHYKKMLEIIGPSGILQLYLAEYDGKVVAASLVSFFGTTATYLHGASSSLYRDVMAPYLVHWEAIRTASQLGYRQYDFGGVNGETYRNPKWQGITRFKIGFSNNSRPTEYMGSYEYIYNPVIFAAYKFVKQIRE